MTSSNPGSEAGHEEENTPACGGCGIDRAGGRCGNGAGLGLAVSRGRSLCRAEIQQLFVNVGGGQSLAFDATYQYSPHWGFELLAALPFEHDVDLSAGDGKVARVKQLPPTLSVQYNFLPHSRIRPYVGAGLNATLFFDEQTSGALSGTDLSLKTSFGPAAQLGVDFDVSPSWFLSFDARWIDIDTQAHLSGADLGDVHIDPLTIGVWFGHHFAIR